MPSFQGYKLKSKSLHIICFHLYVNAVLDYLLISKQNTNLTYPKKCNDSPDGLAYPRTSFLVNFETITVKLMFNLL